MGLYNVKHIAGKNNPLDIFMKEDKDIRYFMAVRNSIMCDFENSYERTPVKENETKENEVDTVAKASDPAALTLVTPSVYSAPKTLNSTAPPTVAHAKDYTVVH